MTAPDPLTLVVRSVDQLREDMSERLTAQDKELKAIREQATRTNGRVTALERKQIAEHAASDAVEKERARVAAQADNAEASSRRVRDRIEVLSMVAMLPATIFAALIASGRI